MGGRLSVRPCERETCWFGGVSVIVERPCGMRSEEGSGVWCVMCVYVCVCVWVTTHHIPFPYKSFT